MPVCVRMSVCQEGHPKTLEFAKVDGTASFLPIDFFVDNDAYVIGALHLAPEMILTFGSCLRASMDGLVEAAEALYEGMFSNRSGF